MYESPERERNRMDGFRSGPAVEEFTATVRRGLRVPRKKIVRDTGAGTLFGKPTGDGEKTRRREKMVKMGTRTGGPN